MLRGSIIHVLGWMQYGGDKCLKVIGLRDGQDGVNKGGSRPINSQLMLVRAIFMACKRDGMEGETFLLVRKS